jgi:ABC-type phosphate/phosphonate transport system substrate-binding protein
MKHTFTQKALLLALAILLSGVYGANAIAQKATVKGEAQNRLVLAINEGGSGNLDATEVFVRYEDFKQVLERALGTPITLVAVRDIKVLRRSVETSAFALVMSRPADILAEAVRDHGYQAVTAAKEPAHALFIVKKESPLKVIGDIHGKSIVTPDQYAYMWRIANAMLRDNKIIMANERVRSMRDQAAIGWSMENGFFDVAVVASFSGVGKTWEKSGGRIIARSPEVLHTPMVASPKMSAAQIQKIRSALLALDSTASGAAVLKKIGLTGFREVSSDAFLDLLKWLGDLPAASD